jgi:hypothetical protein
MTTDRPEGVMRIPEPAPFGDGLVCAVSIGSPHLHSLASSDLRIPFDESIARIS